MWSAARPSNPRRSDRDARSRFLAGRHDLRSEPDFDLLVRVFLRHLLGASGLALPLSRRVQPLLGQRGIATRHDAANSVGFLGIGCKSRLEHLTSGLSNLSGGPDRCWGRTALARRRDTGGPIRTTRRLRSEMLDGHIGKSWASALRSWPGLASRHVSGHRLNLRQWWPSLRTQRANDNRSARSQCHRASSACIGLAPSCGGCLLLAAAD